jgi:hypothetical protein
MFLCASPLPADRAAMLRGNTEYWEAKFDSAAEAELGLRGSADPIDRVDRIQAWREANPAFRYAQAAEALRKHGSVGFEELRPIGIGEQLRYLGLGSGADCAGPERIDVGAQRLLERVGVVEAVRRHAALPRDLPSALREGFSALDPAVRDPLLDELIASMSPVHRVHGILLAQTCAASGAGAALTNWAREGLKATRGLLDIFRCAIAEFAGFEGWPANA